MTRVPRLHVPLPRSSYSVSQRRTAHLHTAARSLRLFVPAPSGGDARGGHPSDEYTRQPSAHTDATASRSRVRTSARMFRCWRHGCMSSPRVPTFRCSGLIGSILGRQPAGKVLADQPIYSLAE